MITGARLLFLDVYRDSYSAGPQERCLGGEDNLNSISKDD